MFLLSFLSLFLSLSVCLCVCLDAISCNECSFDSAHVSFNSFCFLACSFHFPFFTSFTSFQPVLACKPLTKGSHTYICMVRPRVQYLDVCAHYSNSAQPFVISIDNLPEKVVLGT